MINNSQSNLLENNNSNNINYKENDINISFINNFSSFKQNFICLKEDVADLIKLDNKNNININSHLEEELKLKEKPVKKLGKWPLYIIIISAILCFTFSASFHSIGSMSATHHNILNRFDYGGISLLISGSCYPPYYYFFFFS